MATANGCCALVAVARELCRGSSSKVLSCGSINKLLCHCSNNMGLCASISYRVLRHGKNSRVLSYGTRTWMRWYWCNGRVLCAFSRCMVLRLGNSSKVLSYSRWAVS